MQFVKHQVLFLTYISYSGKKKCQEGGNADSSLDNHKHLYIQYTYIFIDMYFFFSFLQK